MSHSPSNLRSPLSRVRGLGSAKDGTGHWWWQRITAIIIAPLSIWFIYSLLTRVIGQDRPAIGDWFASPFVAITALILLGALFYHSKLGVQVIIEDYVHAPVGKYFLLILNVVGSLVLTVVSWIAVLKLHILGI
jgi:succinate dehydrogenase / fumarate reductase membrane anchor subunit